MTPRRRRVRIIPLVAAAAVCLLIAIVAASGPIARGAVAALASSMTKTRVTIGSAHIGLGEAAFTSIDVRSMHGEPIADIADLRVRYSLPDWIAGRRLFGVSSVEANGAAITIVRHKDGSYNVPMPTQGQPGGPTSPIRLDGHLAGTATLIDSGGSRTITSHAAFATAFAFDATAQSSYRARLDYLARGHRYRVAGNGIFGRRSDMQQWRVPAMPIDNLLNFVVPAGIRVASGSIDGADVSVVGIPSANGTLQTVVIAGTTLRNVRFTIPGLRTPVRDIGGRLDISRDAAIFETLHGTLAGVPMHGAGGLYHFDNPQLHLAIAADGDVAQLRDAVAQTGHLPANGRLHIRILAEGPATQPLAMISVRTSSLAYAPMRITNGAVVAAFHGHQLDVLAAHADDGRISADAQGVIALQRQPHALEVIARADAPKSAVPYASTFAGTPLDSTILASSSDLRRINAYGTIDGRTALRQLTGVFAVASDGTGTVGPLVVTGSAGDLFAQAMLDQPHKIDTAYLETRRLWLPMLGGTVSGDGALLLSGRDAIAQIENLQTRNVRIAGVPVQRVSATVAVAPETFHVYAADIGTGSDDILASSVRASGETAIAAGAVPILHGALSVGAIAAGTIAKPELRAATLVVRGLRYNGISASGVAGLRYAKNTLAIRNTEADVADAYLTAGGTVGGLAFGEAMLPHYDLGVTARAADARPFVAIAAPAQARLVDASVDATIHVTGMGQHPSVRGMIDVPEGRINGLAFRDLRGTIAGSRSGMSVSSGSVAVGTTHVAFDGSANLNHRVDVRIAAQNANLADFDDLFDGGDLLSGHGNVAATVALSTGRFASSGNLTISGARFRQFNVGEIAASWTQTPGGIALQGRAKGTRGDVEARGTVDPLARSGTIIATARRVDLTSWLPLFGIQAPVQGFADARAAIAGRFPNLNGTLSASVDDGLVGRIPVQRATIAMQTAGGAARITALTLQTQAAIVTGNGTFGLRPIDPLALNLHGNIADLGTVARVATGSSYDLAGRLDSDVNIRGTLLAPRLHDVTTVDALRYQNVTLPHVASTIDVSPAFARLEARATLQTGTIAFTGTTALDGRFKPRTDAPIAATLTAEDVALSNIAALLPQGTTIDGRVDGTVRAYGALSDPQLAGAISATHLNYSSPLEQTPIAGTGELAFSGRTITLRHASAAVGGGTVVASGAARVPSLGDVGSTAFNLNVVATNATIDAPQYYRGRVDANVEVNGSMPKGVSLGGTVTASSARVPLTAIYNPSSGGTSAPLPVNIAFDQFRLAIGNDVRVQSSNVDVGAKGALDLNGTLAAPKASGAFLATGGTVSFYRTFVVNRARIAFDPSEGIVPRVNAVATTYISDPNTMIRIHVTGPATMMNLGLDSDPTYNRAQILGLLAGAQEFGAVQGVTTTNGRAQSTPASLLSGMAEGQVNQVFTRNLLEPFSNALAGTLGLNDVQLTSVVGQGFGASAGKAFGRHLSAVFSESFGYPKRSSFSLEAKPSIGTALRATVYTVSGQTLFPLSQPPSSDTLNGEVGLGSLMSMQMESGSGGVDFSYVRKFP